MVQRFELDEDDGYLEVAVGKGPPVRLDLYRAHNTFYALDQEHHEDNVALAEEWCKWLHTQGLPMLSHGAAFKLADAVAERVVGLKKSPDSTSPSADSSGPTGTSESLDSPAPDPSAT